MGSLTPPSPMPGSPLVPWHKHAGVSLLYSDLGGGPHGSIVPWEEASSLTWVAKAGNTISSFRVAKPWLPRSPRPGLTAHALEQRLFIGDSHNPQSLRWVAAWKGHGGSK